jgi:hypothetical protein
LEFILKKFRHQFPGSEDISKNASQAGQDLWVISMLNGCIGGQYLEIGCNVPEYTNNTWLLENAFTWTGVSLDVLPHAVDQFNAQRANVAVLADACYVDYADLLRQAGIDAAVIDYLSMDCDPPDVTFKALQQIFNTSGREFKLITFEHDSYLAGNDIRDQSREYLRQQGFELVVSNVSVAGYGAFEDWWANPKYIDPALIAKFKMDDPEAIQDWETVVFID